MQTGSFNYSKAAAKSNSENVVVIWNNPDLALTYLKHWQDRFDQGTPYKAGLLTSRSAGYWRYLLLMAISTARRSASIDCTDSL